MSQLSTGAPKREGRTSPSAATMSVEDAAKLLNIGRNQAYAAAKAGELPILRIGKRILVLCEPLNRMLAGEAPQRSNDAA